MRFGIFIKSISGLGRGIIILKYLSKLIPCLESCILSFDIVFKCLIVFFVLQRRLLYVATWFFIWAIMRVFPTMLYIRYQRIGRF